jgi:hypothetical protein
MRNELFKYANTKTKPSVADFIVVMGVIFIVFQSNIYFDTSIFRALRYVFYSSGFFLTFIGCLNKSTPLSIGKCIVSVSIPIIVILYRNYDVNAGMYYIPVVLISLMLIASLLSVKPGWHITFIKMLFVFGVIHSIFGILFMIFPNIYYNNILPLFEFSERSLKSTLTMLRLHYMLGLTPHYSMIAKHIAFGAIAVFFIHNESKGDSSKRSFVIGAIMFFILFLTGKRAHFVFAFTAVMSTLLLHYFKLTTKALLRIFGMCTLILIAIIVVLQIPQTSIVLQRYIFDFDDLDALTTGRQEGLWLPSMQLFNNSPVIGMGWGAVRYLVHYSTGQNGLSVNGHNIYIQLLAETGIVGFSIFVIYFAYFLIITHKTLNRLKQSSITNIWHSNIYSYLSFSFAMQIFFLLYGFSGNPLYDICNIPYFFACAMSAYYNSKLKSIHGRER